MKNSLWHARKTDATLVEIAHQQSLFTVHYGPAHRISGCDTRRVGEYAALNTPVKRHDLDGAPIQTVRDYLAR